MKHSINFPFGPVLMVSGVVLMVTAVILASTFPWLCVFLGLSGITLFFVGFRFLSGSTYVLCPRCQAKNYIRNRARRTMVTDGVLTCIKCGAMLRRNSN